MGKLRQQLVRHLRLLLTVWLLALAWAPASGAADVTLHARVVQIATTCPPAPPSSVWKKPALAAQRRAPRALAGRATKAHPVATTAVPREPTAATRAAHGPSFDGRTLYLDLRSLLC